MIDELTRDLKYNCDLSDARFWGYFSLCGLLMRYRDLFRSEQGREPWDPVDRGEITAWIQEKESRWPELESRALRDLPLSDGRMCGPFDADPVNKFLEARGLVYAAGYALHGKPNFLLAERLSVEDVEGHRVITTGRELVRDLFSSPAMLQGRTITIRLDPLKALLWDRFVQIAPGRSPVLEEAFRAYGIHAGRPMDSDMAGKFDRMSRAFAGVLIRHELAESHESSPQWRELLAACDDRRSEHFLRALQDLLADTSDRGPLRQIIASRDRSLLAIYLSLMEGYRRLLYPDILEVHARSSGEPPWPEFDEVRRSGHARFREMQRSVLELCAGRAPGSFPRGIADLARRAGACCASAPGQH